MLSLKNFIKRVGLAKALILLFPVAVYLPMIFTNAISIWLVIWVIYKFIKERKHLPSIKKVTVLFTMLYLFILFGFFFEIEYENVIKDLEKKMSLVILPLSIGFVQINNHDLKDVLRNFYLAGLITTTYAFLSGVLNFSGGFNFNNITYHGLSGQIGFHATYLSMYLLFSLSYPLLYSWTITNKKVRFFIWISVLVVTTYIILLSSRIVWVLLFLTFLFVTTYMIRTRKLRKKQLFLIVGLFSLFSSSFFIIAPLKNRMLEALNYKNEYNISEVWGGRGVRMLIWENAVELFKERPLLGYGSSTDVQLNLSQKYSENKVGQLLYMMKNGEYFNAHNQYLEELLKYGIILGMGYLITLFILLIFFLLKSNHVGVFLILIIAIVSVTETIFELNKGIVFITYFVPLLYQYIIIKEGKT